MYKEEEKLNEKQIGLIMSKSTSSDNTAISNGDRGCKKQPWTHPGSPPCSWPWPHLLSLCSSGPRLLPGCPQTPSFWGTPEAWAPRQWDPKSDVPRPVKEEAWKCIKQSGNGFLWFHQMSDSGNIAHDKYVSARERSRERFRTPCACGLVVAASGWMTKRPKGLLLSPQRLQGSRAFA